MENFTKYIGEDFLVNFYKKKVIKTQVVQNKLTIFYFMKRYQVTLPHMF